MLLHQLALRPCPSAMLSYRVVLTLGSERETLYYYNFNGIELRHQKALTTARLYRVAPSVISRVIPLISLLLSTL